jgi:hypothetical protein
MNTTPCLSTGNLPDEKQFLLLKAALFSGKMSLENWEKWCAIENLDAIDGASFRLIPLLHKNLEKYNIKTLEQERLKGISRFHWCKNQILIKAMHSLLSTLRCAGVDVLLLKGGALIFQYYHSPALRPMSDFDFMVPKNQLSKALSIMQGSGWASVDSMMLDDPQVQSTRHSQSFVDSNGNECDLHWTPLREATWKNAEAHFWDTSERLDLPGYNVRVLGPTEHLLHTIVHGGHYNVLPPIRWISDAWIILENDAERIDWDRLLYLGKKYLCATSLRYGLLYLASEFKVEVPPSILLRLEQQIPRLQERIEHRCVTHIVSSYRLDLLLLKAWFRHCKQQHGKSIVSRIITFPSFLRIYLKVNSLFLYCMERFKNILFKARINRNVKGN